MNEWEAAINAMPLGDFTTLLVYADWLQERGLPHEGWRAVCSYRRVPRRMPPADLVWSGWYCWCYAEHLSAPDSPNVLHRAWSGGVGSRHVQPTLYEAYRVIVAAHDTLTKEQLRTVRHFFRHES